jgi:hypothetical protein
MSTFFIFYNQLGESLFFKISCLNLFLVVVFQSTLPLLVQSQGQEILSENCVKVESICTVLFQDQTFTVFIQ